MLGTNFPISEYYRDNIRDAVTISRGGGWWTAAVLIEDPKNGELFVNLYTWQHVEDAWKMRKSFTIRSQKALRSITEALKGFETKLPLT